MKFRIPYHILAWGIPLVLVVISLATEVRNIMITLLCFRRTSYLLSTDCRWFT